MIQSAIQSLTHSGLPVLFRAMLSFRVLGFISPLRNLKYLLILLKLNEAVPEANPPTFVALIMK